MKRPTIEHVDFSEVRINDHTWQGELLCNTMFKRRKFKQITPNTYNSARGDLTGWYIIDDEYPVMSNGPYDTEEEAISVAYAMMVDESEGA